MTVRRLLSHLALFSSFSTQAELLCTQGLAYLLENPDAGSKFTACISDRASITLSTPLTWRAEVRQENGGRPDLEGCTDDKRPAVKIEAKLGAAFSDQLGCYVDDLRQHRSGNGLLMLLVPAYRVKESAAAASGKFTLTEAGRLYESPDSAIAVAVISWEEILYSLASVGGESFRDDLAQFRAMYRVFNGDDPEITTVAEVLGWHDHKEIYFDLVDRVSRRLTPQINVLPRGEEPEPQPNGYYRRYVCRELGNKHPCFSVGARDRFEGYTTPIWLRFRHDTDEFKLIHTRLADANLPQ